MKKRIILAIVALAPAAEAGAADQASVQSPEETAASQRAARQVEAKFGAPDTRAFSDNPQWGVDAAGGAEFGIGTTVPTLHAPAYVLHARLGASLHTPGNWSFVLAGQSGVNMAFNAGNGGPQYGYMVRIPLDAVVEVIYSALIHYKRRQYLNIHAGGLGGGDFLLAAQCQYGACNYIQPSSTLALGLRVGVSFSAVRRSGFGMFATWHNNFGECKVAGDGICLQWISTVVWSLGWTLF